MKSLEKINDISYEELEIAAGDENISVPDGFERECSELIDRLNKKRSIIRFRNIIAWTAVAASLATVFWLGRSLSYRYISPKDTYSDPELAYAEVQKAVDMISHKINKGVESVSMSCEMLERPAKIMNGEK